MFASIKDVKKKHWKENHISVWFTYFPPKMRQIDTNFYNNEDELPEEQETRKLILITLPWPIPPIPLCFCIPKPRQQIKLLNITKHEQKSRWIQSNMKIIHLRRKFNRFLDDWFRFRLIVNSRWRVIGRFRRRRSKKIHNISQKQKDRQP